MRQSDKYISKQDLSNRIMVTATAGLLPDINYTVLVSAVNGDGQGNVSTLNQKTDEEGIIFHYHYLYSIYGGTLI